MSYSVLITFLFNMDNEEIKQQSVIEFTEEEEVLKNFYIEHFENNPNNEFSNFIDYIIKLRNYKKIAAAINFDY